LNFPAPLVRCGGRLPAGHHPAHACFPTRRSSDLPVVLGVFVGILSAIMGVGGGFVLVPAMVYLLRMPAGVVVGTSLFQIIITTSDRKSTRLNSSHVKTSYAVFCLKKKNLQPGYTH